MCDVYAIVSRLIFIFPVDFGSALDSYAAISVFYRVHEWARALDIGMLLWNLNHVNVHVHK